jgi:GDPmannose 4,6-dehydratase
MIKKAFITGITGQDGSYLAEFLLDKGYEVHGMVRRVALENGAEHFSRINHIKNKIILHSGSLESYSRLLEIFDKIKPDECYHLGAQSFVHESFEDCFSTINININGTLHVLSALKTKSPKCKFYFAGSSEMFGKVEEIPQKETTKFHPRSPYGISKLTGYEFVRNFREAYNIFACTGLLFNHESPRRGFEFVTRKITRAIARMKKGEENVLLLGNLDAKRDWGFSGDYVKAMWMILQKDKPDDYVIGTGKTHSVKDFVDLAFNFAGLNYEVIDLHNQTPEQADLEIQNLKQQKNKFFVVQYPLFYRPAEVDLLLADPSKAKKELGWEPTVSFEELVKMMVKSDINEINNK